MQKNDILTGIISSLGYNCEGVCKLDNGIVCFIPFALIGEKVKFKVLKVNKNIAYCKLLEVLSPSEDRVRPLCSVYEKCGGCQIQHAKYTTQLKIKSKIISDCFYKIAGINVNVQEPVKSVNEYGYRNKIQFPIRNTEKGNFVGFFAENSHRIVEVSECPIQQEGTSKLLLAFKQFINETGISCYNEVTKKGILRHVVARNTLNALTIVAVVNSNMLPHSDKLIKILQNYFKKFSLFVNENKEDGNVITGKNYTLLYGEPYYYDEVCKIKYPVVCQSFIQVNDYIKVKLYNAVASKLNDIKDLTVIDAYSGAGIMTAMLAKQANKAIGIEIVKEAVNSANILAKENGLDNKITNICAPCEEVLPSIIEAETKNGANVAVVLDPPRKGCDIKVLNALIKEKPNHIIYVSCSPQTLARDIGILTGHLNYDGNKLLKSQSPTLNYEITSVKPYDMFPQTKHVETLVVLQRK